jgi:hypothetical protein
MSQKRSLQLNLVQNQSKSTESFRDYTERAETEDKDFKIRKLTIPEAYEPLSQYSKSTEIIHEYHDESVGSAEAEVRGNKVLDHSKSMIKIRNNSVLDNSPDDGNKSFVITLSPDKKTRSVYYTTQTQYDNFK